MTRRRPVNKNHLCFCASAANVLEARLEMIAFTVIPKRIKYLKTNLAKEVQDLCTENHRKLLKAIKEDLNNGRACCVRERRGWSGPPN